MKLEKNASLECWS